MRGDGRHRRAVEVGAPRGVLARLMVPVVAKAAHAESHAALRCAAVAAAKGRREEAGVAAPHGAALVDELLLRHRVHCVLEQHASRLQHARTAAARLGLAPYLLIAPRQPQAQRSPAPAQRRALSRLLGSVRLARVRPAGVARPAYIRHALRERPLGRVQQHHRLHHLSARAADAVLLLLLLLLAAATATRCRGVGDAAQQQQWPAARPQWPGGSTLRVGVSRAGTAGEPLLYWLPSLR